MQFTPDECFQLVVATRPAWRRAGLFFRLGFEQAFERSKGPVRGRVGAAGLAIRGTSPRAIAAGEVDRGIVLGGSGNGEANAANRVRGVRCGLCWNEQVAVWSRSHNDANCLSLGERTLTLEEALKIVRVWLATEFEGGRHIPRIQKLDSMA